MTADQRLQWPLITKTGTNDENHTIRYYYNYSSEPRGITYAYGNGTELVSGSPVEKNQRLTINPWDLLIIEEPDR
jgi:beta-galactosidase